MKNNLDEPRSYRDIPPIQAMAYYQSGALDSNLSLKKEVAEYLKVALKEQVLGNEMTNLSVRNSVAEFLAGLSNEA
jgi:hypothetical protein